MKFHCVHCPASYRTKEEYLSHLSGWHFSTTPPQTPPPKEAEKKWETWLCHKCGVSHAMNETRCFHCSEPKAPSVAEGEEREDGMYSEAELRSQIAALQEQVKQLTEALQAAKTGMEEIRSAIEKGTTK